MYSPSHRHTMPVQRSASPPSFGKAEAVRTVREHERIQRGRPAKFTRGIASEQDEA